MQAIRSLSHGMQAVARGTRWCGVNLLTGDIVQSNVPSASVASPGNGEYRVRGTAQIEPPLCPQSRASPSPDGVQLYYQGDGVSGICAGRFQVEKGTEASPVQTFGAPEDVIEPGQPDIWHLAHDQVDDRLTVDLPEFSGATEFWTGENGVAISTGIDAAAGLRDLPAPARLYAYGVVNRALTDAETDLLTAYLNNLRGD